MTAPHLTRQHERFPVRPLIAACCATAIANLPAFLVGSLALRMRAELQFTTAGTGLAISAFSAASALTGPLVGRVVQRGGPMLAFRAGACVTALTLVGIAAAAHSWGVLVLLLVFAGVANAVNQTAANLALAQHGATERDGLAFGTKQAAVPFSSMLAGFAVPVFVGALGWRWAFVLGSLMAAVVAVVAPRLVVLRTRAPAAAPASGTPSPPDAPPVSHAAGPIDWPLIILAASGAFFASGSALSVAVFIVEFAVQAGASEASAGTLLAFASVVVLVVRVLAGVWIDRRTRRGRPRVALVPAAAMIALGGLGMLLILAATSWPALLPAGVVLALGMGWGWPGLMHFTVVSMNRGAAAITTGVLLAGVFGGGVVIPALTGTVIERASYGAAWTITAACMGVAVVAMLFANHRLRLPELQGTT